MDLGINRQVCQPINANTTIAEMAATRTLRRLIALELDSRIRCDSNALAIAFAD